MNQKKYFNLSERKFLLRVIDAFIILLSLYFSFQFLDFSYFNFNNENLIKWILLLFTYYLIFGEIFQLFNLNISNNRYLVVRSIVVTTFATVIFYIFTPYISPVLPNNRLQIVYFFLVLTIPVIVWRFIYISVIFSPKYFKTVVFVGKKERIEKMVRNIYNDNFHNLISYYSDKEIEGVKGYKNIETTKISDCLDGLPVNELIVSREGFSENYIADLNKELILLFKKGINIVGFASFYEEVNSRIPKGYLATNFYEYLNFSKNNTNRFYLFGLRVVDILVSIVGILVFICISPIIIIGNLIGNRGSIFYTQTRVGQNGNHFKIFKLRSMVKNAEKDGAVWAQKNDIRITSFGKFLRHTRLDEVPQFFNILKGEMSIIGPRPERPEFVKDLEEKIPFYAIRHVVRPGLTGWAQVNYPYANTIEEQETKLRYDLYYIKERNAFLDFKILIKTITTVLFYRGQ
ncbi:exopolysaccharide biosynthesis polyprenyl glycosylphosphotransferase [Polaribacter aestuariivivens]|uniref:Exopolysaccharide biosynthesis polyprenyl glycosylphosphotransferase n=1 Tax=Polaribacter aestuariivivens TaxID=2304626 RepID=A0A5S3N7P4_9FLAO|nr:exopolysaccharide biosynthesis polyprenyl glycosylphosphotransferase [Polaribacter aestuariivivens]TMM31333.1 exopolysaccharide biosynthesis polyprenyl glycosylphosphotransferase [Polaribacter aestuariivivens]